MKRKIHKLLNEMRESKEKSLLSEGAKIFKSKPTANKSGVKGYWLYIASDSTDGNTFKKENTDMSSTLNLTKTTQKDWKKSFVAPVWTKPVEGSEHYGWGYFITTNHPEFYGEKMYSNLKELLRDYNLKKNLSNDAEQGELTLDQVGEIQDLVSAIEGSLAKEMNEETKQKLEAYLDELELAVEQDEVYEFLSKKYEEANKFKNNQEKISNKHIYTITNAMIILAAQPDALIAAQKDFWEGRNYQIKPGFEGGIHIVIPDATETRKTAQAVYSKGRWDNYKREYGVPAGKKFFDYIKENPKKHNVDLAYYAISNGLVPTQTNLFGFGSVYTDTMVEPIPGKIAEPIEDILGRANISTGEDELHIKQKELGSGEHRQLLIKLFDALEAVSEKEKINTAGFRFKKDDINDFNRVLNALAYNKFEKKMGKQIGGEAPNKEILEEMLNGYAEVISNLVKKHYGLPSEESKYNIARQGIDRDEIQKAYSEVIRIAHKIINEIDAQLEVGIQEPEAINEIRKIVRSVLRNI